MGDEGEGEGKSSALAVWAELRCYYSFVAGCSPRHLGRRGAALHTCLPYSPLYGEVDVLGGGRGKVNVGKKASGKREKKNALPQGERYDVYFST